MSNTNAASTTRGEQFRRARAIRIRRTRRHVAAAGLSTFALAWAAIAAVGSQGATTAPKEGATTAPKEGAITAPKATTSISAPTTSSTNAESESARSVSPVTTRQS